MSIETVVTNQACPIDCTEWRWTDGKRIRWHWHRYDRWSDVKAGFDRYGDRCVFQERRCLVCNQVERRYPGPGLS